MKSIRVAIAWAARFEQYMGKHGHDWLPFGWTEAEIAVERAIYVENMTDTVPPWLALEDCLLELPSWSW